MIPHELLTWSLAIGIPLAVIFCYKVILRVFFGVVIVPEDKLGLVTKKFVLLGKQELPEGRIIAIDGELVSRHKHYPRVSILLSGRGNMILHFNLLLLSQLARLAWYWQRMGANWRLALSLAAK